MGLSTSESTMFSMLPQRRVPWYKFAFSYGTLAVVVAIFVWVPLLHPEILETPRQYLHLTSLVPVPVPVNHTPQRQLPPRPIPVVEAKLDPPPAVLHLAAPRPQPKPKVEDTPAPEVKVAEKKLDLPPAKAPVIPQTVKLNNFPNTGSSAPQTTRLAAAQVQTGGFGDPNGVPAKLNQGKAPVNIAQAGGFDMPTGPGVGNGTGGANGARGVVASTGFGGGVAVQSNKPSRGVVRQAGFGDDVPAPPTVQSRPAAAAIAKITPAEIISKPNPVYTDEARSKKIEGEVLLEVVFEATGKIHVLRIVRGLGHGLDDAAVHAAEQIRFKPALKDGQPSDQTAVVHIIFQLA
jgi:TonB family protein